MRPKDMSETAEENLRTWYAMDMQELRARQAMDAGDYTESARLFEPTAALGSEYALSCLSWMYKSRHLARSASNETMSLWENAAKAGSASAKSYLAWAMHPELERAWRAFDAEDYEEAARLLEPLAARGSETALLHLGWLYSKGHLGPANREKAIALWEEAARAGSATAKHYLGWALRKSGDLRRARALFIEGAEQGHTPCMNKAGRMLVRGQGGEADLQAGVAWLTRAADSGHVYARRELFRLEALRARSWFGRVWVYGKMVRYIFSSVPRLVRNPDGDDFR